MPYKVKRALILLGIAALVPGLALSQAQDSTPGKPLVMYPFPAAGIWHALTIIAGVSLVAIGILKKEFTPNGLTTMFIWGADKNSRIPRRIAAPAYIVVGLLILYFGFAGKL